MASGLSFLPHHALDARMEALGVAALLRRWARRWRTRRALATLSPWQLADVGLDRCAATAETRKPFWRG